MVEHTEPSETENILVIKHGALGDVVLATAPFSAIRAEHPNATITLLSTKLYASLLKDSPYFDEIWVDARPKLWQFGKFLALMKQLRSKKWTKVYDLQTSSRSSSYYGMFPAPKPDWSGIVKGCSHEHSTPRRTTSHTIDRQQEQLKIAGIDYTPKVDISWLKSDVSKCNVYTPYALLIAGGSAHRPEKRWPEESFAKLAVWLMQRGIEPVLIGTEAEREVLDVIEVTANAAIAAEKLITLRVNNLCNQTSFADISTLAQDAALAVGNDTGPMHLAAASGCESVVLFSHASNPDLCAPRGEHVQLLRKPTLDMLELEEVLDTLKTNPALASSAAIA